jgi:hypothetical protein
MNIALRKRARSPVGIVLEYSSKYSFMKFVVVSFQLRSIIKSMLVQSNPNTIRPKNRGIISISKTRRECDGLGA